MSQEVDYLMSVVASGVVVHDSPAHIVNNISEWFDTPRGSIYGNPDWGNEYEQFQHEPTDEDTAVAIENYTYEALPRDVKDLLIRGVRAEPVLEHIDRYLITILTNYGVIGQEIAV